LRNPPRDEFAFDSARENDAAPEGADGAEDEAAQPKEETVFVQDRLFAANPTPAARGFWLDRKAGWRVVDGPADGGFSLLCEEHNGTRACPHCSPAGRKGSELIWPLRFGAPFILGNAAPILLEGVEPAKAEAGEKLPSAGRRLLSFTDSRQGTARMAAKLQIESEHAAGFVTGEPAAARLDKLEAATCRCRPGPRRARPGPRPRSRRASGRGATLPRARARQKGRPRPKRLHSYVNYLMAERRGFKLMVIVA